MSHKQEAIDRVTLLAAKPGGYRPPDPLIAFLEALSIMPTTSGRSPR